MKKIYANIVLFVVEIICLPLIAVAVAVCDIAIFIAPQNITDKDRWKVNEFIGRIIDRLMNAD